MKSKNVKALVPFQLLSGIGAISWVYDIRKNPPKSGILKEKIFKEPVYEILITTFLIGSIMWPLSLKQKNITTQKTKKKTLLSVVGLLIAAVSGIIAQAGTFENDNSSVQSLISITVFNITVVLLDGIGWSSRIIYQTLHPP